MGEQRRAYSQNSHNRFDKLVYEPLYDGDFSEEHEDGARTVFHRTYPKTILNEVKSKDIPAKWSMNPYQGCEHGCSYCYARPTHNYWGYSAGLDFERVILYKPEVAQLLKKAFHAKSWRGEKIMLSGNTDCYQPVERKLGLTRKLLETCLEYRNPVSIITKNNLVRRDIDLLRALAEKNLVSVAISVTTLNEDLRRKLEPRTAAGAQRVETIRLLAEVGIPTAAMMAPVIPSLNDHEILNIAAETAQAGARGFGYTMLRLNGELEPLFEDWLNLHYPDRKNRVMNQVREVHGGKTGSNEPSMRMSGSGNWADMVKQQVRIAKKKYFPHQTPVQLNETLFRIPGPQLGLWEQ
jgi:DNA repair photolyase